MAFSCYYNANREGENYVEQHTFAYQISGSLTLFDGRKEYQSEKGTLRLVRRNQLMKFIKEPDEKEPFQSLSIYLSQDFLKDFAREQNIKVKRVKKKVAVMNLTKDRLLENYLNSIAVYIQTDALEDPLMVDAKLSEGLLLLLKTNPDVATVLFDFSEPYKLDLQPFMQQNYYFNVRLERFAYLTGRSLAAFKRDFEKEFGTSPGKWLIQKRLEEARRLLSETPKTVSEIYLDLGFEDLSHFSHAFKKQFGVAPTRLRS
ncbi:MAG: helix-turn-helix transcriptional regulator [Sporocytophaga sp.]|nr:helix-turn-helix transcriptional regulator [Sporocytophaga sp.]